MSSLSSKPLRVVFMGTPAFSVPTLEALLADPAFEVLGVLTQPDKPAGRGQQLTPPAVKVRALAAGLPVLQPKRLRTDEETLTWLKTQQAQAADAKGGIDYFVTVAFGQILSQEVLDIPQFGTVNVHASLLPAFRGPNPIQQAILQGLSETGITTMLTDIGVDTGDMLLVEKLSIGENETTGELAIRMAQAGGPLLTRTLKEHAAGSLTPTPQPHEKASHAPKCEKHQAAIDWTLSAQEIHNCIRAFNPAPGAYAEFQGQGSAQRVKFLGSALESAPSNSEELLKSAIPGEILTIIKDRILIKTGENKALNQSSILSILEVQPAGKKPMNAADWARNLPKTPEGKLTLCSCP